MGYFAGVLLGTSSEAYKELQAAIESFSDTIIKNAKTNTMEKLNEHRREQEDAALFRKEQRDMWILARKHFAMEEKFYTFMMEYATEQSKNYNAMSNQFSLLVHLFQQRTFTEDLATHNAPNSNAAQYQGLEFIRYFFYYLKKLIFFF
jgi:hypothetical protein